MPSSTATITKAQRDGLYALVRNYLGGLSDVFVEMEQRKDFDAAERLGREFAEDFRLLDDIGWQPNDGREAVALTMPLGELSELLQRLQDEAGRLLTESPAERRSSEEDDATNRALPRRPRHLRVRALRPRPRRRLIHVEHSPQVAARFAKNLRRCRERSGLSQSAICSTASNGRRDTSRSSAAASRSPSDRS
jgi:hypothetical protein